MSVLLDTSVLVYAVGGEHDLAAPAQALVAAIADRRLGATTTIEVLQEFAHVRARRRDRASAADLARDFATLLAPLVVVDADDLEGGLSIFAREPRLGAFDSILAAAAIRRGARLVTADDEFASVQGLRVVGLADAPATLLA